MKRWIVCLILISVMIGGPGCGTVKEILKTVAISKKINDIKEEPNTLVKLKLLKELIEENQ